MRPGRLGTVSEREERGLTNFARGEFPISARKACAEFCTHRNYYPKQYEIGP